MIESILSISKVPPQSAGWVPLDTLGHMPVPQAAPRVMLREHGFNRRQKLPHDSPWMVKMGL